MLEPDPNSEIYRTFSPEKARLRWGRHGILVGHRHRHCGTGIWPDRDIAAGWRATRGASLPTRSPSQPRTAARKAGVLDPRRQLRERDGLSAGGNWIRTSRTGCDESGFRSFCVAPDVCSRDMGMPQEATAIVDWPQSSWCSDAALSPQPKMSDEANFRASAIAAPLRASAWSENRVRKERSPKTPLLALAPCRLIGWPCPTLRRLP